MKKFTLTMSLSLLLTGGLFAQVTNGLIAHYKLDGDAVDASSNGLDGTVTGAMATTNYNNEAASAMLFSSSAEYIEVPHDAKLQPTSGLTVSAWVYINSFSGTSSIIMKGTADQVEGSYLLRYNENQKKLVFRINFSGNTPDAISSNSTLNSGEWYHVLGSYDGSFMKVYINGLLDNSKAVSQTLGTNTDIMRIGRTANASFPYPVDGKIDDVQIFDRALTEDEIDQIYGIISSTKNVSSNGLVDIYPNPSTGIINIELNNAIT